MRDIVAVCPLHQDFDVRIDQAESKHRQIEASDNSGLPRRQHGPRVVFLHYDGARGHIAGSAKVFEKSCPHKRLEHDRGKR
ncbi:hypothetical protein GCM10007880_62220 [Mesorhizobium amorphae]|nr:hypothetical protein GCM10007880_62220 [Mesorhizobium amorphae]